MSDLDDLVDELRAERVRLGLSQGQVGARMGVAGQKVCAWELKANGINAANLIRWANCLGFGLVLMRAEVPK